MLEGSLTRTARESPASQIRNSSDHRQPFTTDPDQTDWEQAVDRRLQQLVYDKQRCLLQGAGRV